MTKTYQKIFEKKKIKKELKGYKMPTLRTSTKDGKTQITRVDAVAEKKKQRKNKNNEKNSSTTSC